MLYPSQLIPQANYRLINPIDPVAGNHLLRWSSVAQEEFFDELTELPAKEEYIELQTKNIKDISTSLLGTFLPEHYAYRLNKLTPERRSYLVFDLWPQGEEVVKPPENDEWAQVEPPTFYHLPIAALHDLTFPFKYIDESFTATLRVLHTPCRSNYWHFSIRVFDDQGEDIASRYPHSSNKKINKRDRAILKAARDVVRISCRRGVPNFEPVQRNVYVSQA